MLQEIILDTVTTQLHHKTKRLNVLPYRFLNIPNNNGVVKVFKWYFKGIVNGCKYCIFRIYLMDDLKN